jgi:hypothetical protein
MNRGRSVRDVFEGFVGHRVDRLDLHRLHEALRLGIVIWISAPAHRADEAVRGEDLAITLSGVLGRFKWSSQRLMRSYDDQIEAASLRSFW